MNLNKAQIIGNLTRDPEVKSTPNGITVATFSVATSYMWKDQSGQRQEKAEFHNVVAWRRLAEIVGQYLKKGSKVYIEGRLQTRDWLGQDGVKRYRTEIIAENVIMLDRPTGNTSGGSMGGGSVPAPSEPALPTVTVEETNYAEDDIKVENIPF
jgi:single-strand DNA-binding protein